MNNKIQEIKHDLSLATPDWHDNGNEIVSLQNPKVGIGGFLKDEDNKLAAKSPEYIAYLLSEYDRMKEALEQISNTTISQYANLKEMILGIKLTASRALEDGANR